MGHLDSHVIFDRALFARQSCAVGKRIPLRLQRASYRANNWVTTAQNWCRGSVTEIGRKTAKTARDAKMFDATECWEYVATVYRDILPGKCGWIAVHWIMLESAQNWSPNGTLTGGLNLEATNIFNVQMHTCMASRLLNQASSDHCCDGLTSADPNPGPGWVIAACPADSLAYDLPLTPQRDLLLNYDLSLTSDQLGFQCDGCKCYWVSGQDISPSDRRMPACAG